MPCFFIGPPDRAIFANLTEPRRPRDCDNVVILCYPFGQEYMRAHRAYRQLANLLGRAGLPVLRFDYPATGDSYLDKPWPAFTPLFSDLERVVDAARVKSGKSNVYLVGLRFGALVAAAMAEKIDGIGGLFLWDAYANGQSFVADCASQLDESIAIEPDAQEWLVHGYPLTEKFRNDIAAIDISGFDFDSSLKICHTISSQTKDSKILLESMGSRIQQNIVLSSGDWNYVDMEGSILMPTELIKELARSIVEA